MEWTVGVRLHKVFGGWRLDCISKLLILSTRLDMTKLPKKTSICSIKSPWPPTCLLLGCRRSCDVDHYSLTTIGAFRRGESLFSESTLNIQSRPPSND